jgi:hypothetical protein
MILTPTLDPDDIFNQAVEMNRERQREIRLEDEVNRLSQSRELNWN